MMLVNAMLLKLAAFVSICSYFHVLSHILHTIECTLNSITNSFSATSCYLQFRELMKRRLLEEKFSEILRLNYVNTSTQNQYIKEKAKIKTNGTTLMRTGIDVPL